VIARARKSGRESGQAMVLVCVFLVVILGMVGLAVDVGAWYKADRDTQATADAAALAAAQALPDTSAAGGLADDFAGKNGGGLTSVTYSSTLRTNDTVTTVVKRDTPAYFTKIFGFSTVGVGSTASARFGVLSEAKAVAPFVVSELHPLLKCDPNPCKGDTSIVLDKMGAPGAFGVLLLDNAKGGGNNEKLADWILDGYQDALPLGNYLSDSGARFDSSVISSAMDARVNTVLLFPVFRTLSGSGSNAVYQIIGWAAFYMTSWEAKGHDAVISGHFTQVIWEGLPATSGSGPDFGAHTVQLVK
jgi:Flp pilus assembly protein TadG